MDKDKDLKAKVFFELGIAFAQFSATPDDTKKYETTRRIASSLGLKLPDYSDLKNQLWWEFVPPAKWFAGLNGESFKNCYEIGKLSYLRFLLSLPSAPNTQTERIDETVRQLVYLLKVENIPEKVLNDYLASLETADADTANASLRTFVGAFSIALHDKSTEPSEKIFCNLNPPPSVFKGDVLEALKQTIDEASNCYKHEYYLATIVLCGRIIETLIANAYQVVFGKDALDDKNTGFADMRNALRSKDVPLKKDVDTQLVLIYQIRSAVIHGEVKIPTKDQAQGIAILTQHVINIIFNHFNNLPAPEKYHGKLLKDWQSTHKHGDIIFGEDQKMARAYRDCFLHEFDSLRKGQSVEFELEPREGNRPRARNVVVVEDEE